MEDLGEFAGGGIDYRADSAEAVALAFELLDEGELGLAECVPYIAAEVGGKV